MANRRRAPIRIAHTTAGAAISSSGFLGTVAAQLTDTLREMQIYEQLKNLANGDPETFLAFSDGMLKKVKNSPIGTILAQYVTQARNKLVEVKADAAAYSSYARTNNHQAMLDYLVGKANATTDPAVLSKLIPQINELRTRVFKSSAGSASLGNSGVVAQDLQDSRDDWAQKLAEISTRVKDGKTLTPQDVQDAKTVAGQYSAMLVQVEHSNAPDSARKAAFTARTKADGPKDGVHIPWLTDRMGESDANLRKQFDGDQSNVALSDIEAAKTDAEKVKLWAQRTVQLQYVATHALTDEGRVQAGLLIQKAEQNGEKLLNAALETTKKLPGTQEQVISQLYDAYLGDGGTKSISFFKEKLAHAPDAKTFAKLIGDRNVFAPDDFSAAQSASRAYGPATWDDATGTFSGSPEQVQSAKDIVDAIKTWSTVPGNPYIQNNGVIDPTQLSDKDWWNVANGTWTPDMQTYGPSSTLNQGPWAAGGALDESTRAARDGGATAEAPAEAGKVGQSSPMAMPLPEEAGGGIGVSAPQEEPDMEQRRVTRDANDRYSEYDDILGATDQYLKTYDPPDLPQFAVPEEQPQPDWEKLLPTPERPFGLGRSQPQ